jgi:hypothetical protein
MEAAMPDDLYERDILDWSARQAELLRRLAAGERVNAAVDWPHVIEEVQDLGLSELRACESLLRQAMVHLLKLAATPNAPAAAHWRGEIAAFLGDAAARVTPAMRRRIDLDTLWTRALRQLAAEQDAPLIQPAACPYTLDELLAPAASVSALARRVLG